MNRPLKELILSHLLLPRSEDVLIVEQCPYCGRSTHFENQYFELLQRLWEELEEEKAEVKPKFDNIDKELKDLICFKEETKAEINDLQTDMETLREFKKKLDPQILTDIEALLQFKNDTEPKIVRYFLENRTLEKKSFSSEEEKRNHMREVGDLVKEFDSFKHEMNHKILWLLGKYGKQEELLLRTQATTESDGVRDRAMRMIDFAKKAIEVVSEFRYDVSTILNLLAILFIVKFCFCERPFIKDLMIGGSVMIFLMGIAACFNLIDIAFHVAKLDDNRIEKTNTNTANVRDLSNPFEIPQEALEAGCGQLLLRIAPETVTSQCRFLWLHLPKLVMWIVSSLIFVVFLGYHLQHEPCQKKIHSILDRSFKFFTA